jgi:proteasome lid subunit RPN8/RPN11
MQLIANHIMDISDSILADVRTHAATTDHVEACGLIVVRKGRQKYLPCRNLSRNGRDTFILSPEDYAAAEDEGEIVAIVHSHPYDSPEPSQADRIACERSGLPWLIVNHPIGHYTVTVPSGYRAPLIGREFVHGVVDCYTLVRDYYNETLQTELPDFTRNENWWNEGQNLYVENFASAGFVVVSDAPRAHDVLLMQVRAPVINHAAVYLGDEMILHHMHGRLSSRDIYGGYWQHVTIKQLRHRSKL